MKRCGSTRYAAAMVAAILALLLFTADHATSQAPRPAGWYISLGVGANQAATLEQAGNNRDTTCYPNRDCTHLDGGSPAGFRWFYDLQPAAGTAVELAVGRTVGAFRLELAGGRQRLDLEQEFTGSTYLDGSAILPLADSGYAARNTAGVDGLTLHTLSLNAYYDLPLPQSRLTPYVGAGLGVAFAELSGLHYSVEYSCTDPARCDNPQRFNGRQDVDMSDTVASVHLHAGADYRLGERLLLGVKLSYSLAEDMREVHGYTYHAVPGLTNETRISGIAYGTVLVNLKYRIGNGPSTR